MAVARLFRIALHIVSGVLTIMLIFPYCREAARLSLIQRWSRRVLDILGVSLSVQGAKEGSMRVANHISWLDVFVINSVVPSTFVAKDDVRRWPVIGWLCSQTGTIFMRRDARKAARTTAMHVTARLETGSDVVFFPEGTTSDGRKVLPFYGALLQGSVTSGQAVQPVLLRYETASGATADSPVYCGETSLLASMWRIAATPGVTARMVLLPTRKPDGIDRRELARTLRADISTALLAASMGPDSLTAVGGCRIASVDFSGQAA